MLLKRILKNQIVSRFNCKFSGRRKVVFQSNLDNGKSLTQLTTKHRGSKKNTNYSEIDKFHLYQIHIRHFYNVLYLYRSIIIIMV